jgi:hypothetical protein
MQVNGRGQSKIEALSAFPPFDHCQFDAMPTLPAARADAFKAALSRMTMADPFQVLITHKNTNTATTATTHPNHHNKGWCVGDDPLHSVALALAIRPRE